LILVRFTGGLGNQMFQYAFAKSIASKNNTELKFDVSLLGGDSNVKDLVVRHFDLDVFLLQEQWASKDEIVKFNGYDQPNLLQKVKYKIKRFSNKFPLIIQNGHDFNIEQIKGIGSSACIIGRWQSEDFFKENSETIKKAFDFSHFTPNTYSKEIVKQMKNGVAVAVQVRRGDYVTHPIYSKQIGALNKQYYLDAIELLTTYLSTGIPVTYYFISDDINWCKKNFNFMQNAFFVEQEKSKNGYVSDLWLLTQAQHSIISNSTFSWWGAYLGETSESIIIAPKNWLREKNASSNQFVPARWIKIDNEFELLNN
jgi:hypothetical protein